MTNPLERLMDDVAYYFWLNKNHPGHYAAEYFDARAALNEHIRALIQPQSKTDR